MLTADACAVHGNTSTCLSLICHDVLPNCGEALLNTRHGAEDLVSIEPLISAINETRSACRLVEVSFPAYDSSLYLSIMATAKNTSSVRLTQVKDFLTGNKTATTIPFDPNSTKFPTRKQLPIIPGAPEGAAWVWGDDDNVRASRPTISNKF